MAIIWNYLPLALHGIFLFVLSSLSHPEQYVPSLLLRTGDKTLHGVAYALLGILLYRVVVRAKGEGWCAVCLAILGSALYGVSDELHQAFVPLRTADGLDLMADILGASTGVFVWRWLVPAQTPPSTLRGIGAANIPVSSSVS